MSQPVRELEPSSMWNHFADLNAVPRPSKKEEKVIEFAKQFGESLGLKTLVDEVGNVIIAKPATSGMEDRVPVVLQSHLDMVHQKNADTTFDFATQGIEMIVEGDWVRANGTTLGADNGIGVASIMTILASDDIPHPPIEALFTIDEETGMTGAKGLKGGVLNSKIMLNLDTEDDDELTIGCAGGIDVVANGTYEPVSTSDSMTGIHLIVRGLKGGHSGMDIHLGRGNSNKIMNRILWNVGRQFDIQVGEIDGGGLRNAIPRESVSTFAVATESADQVAELIEAEVKLIKLEYATTDPAMEIVVEQVDCPLNVVPPELQRTLLAVLYSLPCGIHRMSPEIDDLVQTSNNVARVELIDGKLSIACLTRSSVNSERDDLANAIAASLELLDVTIERGSSYPGWQPKPDSSIANLMSNLYQEMFGEPANVSACHAGLECGIVGTNYPDMEMISFGPNIRGAHSPDERVQISSVQKYWKFFLETLKRIPAAS